MRERAIEVVGVTKAFRPPATLRRLMTLSLRGPPVTALAGVDLALKPGEAIALVGENGAGKSTLLRILAGLVTPSAGRASVWELDTARGGPALAHVVGYVPGDERGLPAHLSPRELLAFYASLYGLRRAAALARADALLEEVGLRQAARRPLRELSTGMRRRTALARGLLGQARVLLLDEPTRGIDPLGAAALRALISARRRAGSSLVIATHDLAEAEGLCDRVAELAAGRVVADEPSGPAAARLRRAAGG